MTRAELIDTVARAICNEHDIDPDMAIGINGSMPKWAIDDAEAAIKAMERAGWKEPQQ